MRNRTGDMRKTMGRVRSKEKLIRKHKQGRWDDGTAMDVSKQTVEWPERDVMREEQ